MDLIMTMLVGTLMGAFFVGFFLLGVKVGHDMREDKKEKEVNGVELTDSNAKMVESMINFNAYDGTFRRD